MSCWIFQHELFHSSPFQPKKDSIGMDLTISRHRDVSGNVVDEREGVLSDVLMFTVNIKGIFRIFYFENIAVGVLEK